MFEEIGLCVVNSDRSGFERLETLSGADKWVNSPDFIICNPLFAVQQMLLDQDKTLLNSVRAGQPRRFLDDICIVEGKVDQLQDLWAVQMAVYLVGHLDLKLERKMVET